MRTRRLALFTFSFLWLATPTWATTANDLCASNANPCVVSTAVTVTNNSIIDVGARELRIDAGGVLEVGTGTMTIAAAVLTVNSGGFLRASGSSSVSGGTINLNVGQATIDGSVDANGSPGGTIAITSAGAVSVGGNSGAPGLTARALSREEVGGTIVINAAEVMLAFASALGGSEGLGGDVTINTTGSITVTGTINAVGGDGGGIDLEAGREMQAGNITLTSSSALRADPNGDGGFGGTVDVVAHGDGLTTGNVVVDGLISAIGDTSGLEVGGGAGGCITVDGDGRVGSTRTAASITVAGGGPDGDGGEIEMVSDGGPVEYAGSLNAGSAGLESTGGIITIDAFGDAVLPGMLVVSAGDGGGGEITVASSSALVHVPASGRLDARSSSGGSGGSICIENGLLGDGPRTILIEGRLEADGASAAAGGTIEIDGGDAVRIAAGATLRAAGALGSGVGGAISVAVANGPALIDGALVASGGSPGGAGGLIVVDADEAIVLNAPADARGFGAGGEVGLSSNGPIDVRRDITASSSTAAGGSIEIVSQGDVTIAAQLVTDGVVVPAPRIDIEGCMVTICGLDSPVCAGGGTGVLSSLGPEGVNRIIGRDATVVLGTMRANAVSGRNELLYDGNPASEPAILGTVTPGAMVIASEEVRACPACGNNLIDPPETCDDGNQLDGDGCSASCQIEAPILGDANNDRDLTAADREAAVQEIFDGDGDEIGMVSAGSFRGGPGADANEDEHVTAADLVAITRLLAP